MCISCMHIPCHGMTALMITVCFSPILKKWMTFTQPARGALSTGGAFKF